MANIMLMFCIGPCEIANQGGQDFECAPDGTFEPLQCQSTPDGLISCVCVNPSSGEIVQDSDMFVADRDDAPDCDRLG